MKGHKLWPPNAAYPEESLSLQWHHHWRTQQRWLSATLGAKVQAIRGLSSSHCPSVIAGPDDDKNEDSVTTSSTSAKRRVTRYPVLTVLCVSAYLSLIFGLTHGRVTQKLQCKMVLLIIKAKCRLLTLVYHQFFFLQWSKNQQAQCELRKVFYSSISIIKRGKMHHL